MTVRIATYARVSTADQADTGTSLADQERRLKAAVTARGGLLVEHFVDAGVSGAADSRPGLDGLRRAVQSLDIDAVMATKIDRVSRSAVGLLALIEELRRSGCHLVLIDEGLDTSTAAGDLTSGLLGVIGGWERKRIADRTTQGRRSAAEIEGRFVGSTPPFGYRVAQSPIGKGKRLVVHEGEATTVRRMFELLIVEQRTVGVAARILNDEGHGTQTGLTWTTISLGRWALRQEPLRAASGVWVFDGIHVSIPAILSPVEAAAWRAWQDDRRQPQTSRGSYLLSGMFLMPCGLRAMGRTAGKQRPTYCCRLHYLPKGDPDRHDNCVNVSCASVDTAVTEHIQRVLAQPEVLRQAASERVSPKNGSLDHDNLVAELQRVEQSLSTEAKLFREQGYVGNELIAVLAPLHQRRQALSRELAHSQQAPGGRKGRAVTELTELLEHGLSHASRQTWRQLLTALEVSVTIDGYQPCPDCPGTGYLPFPPNQRRRWPRTCPTCLSGTVPTLTIEYDDIAAFTLTLDHPQGASRQNSPEVDARRGERGRTAPEHR
ncbi:recombinase family protein [Segeticoccus rhizosphaerae]|uniref:recombinase family protein n=1 Tax=Segeticoccus rhizosphaerae TaxID=1104777 RepID=UPI00126507CA|nr:recombinase family protein [Segeticoccus rhizosphaerae]